MDDLGVIVLTGWFVGSVVAALWIAQKLFGG